MMCIVLSGESGSEFWAGNRSVEVLAYHHAEKTVKILFLLLLDNKKPGNYLKMLHPGNSHCDLIEPWDKEKGPWDLQKEKGLPYHVTEDDDGLVESVLESVYGRMFEYDEDKGKLYQKEELNPYESFFCLETKREVAIWPNDEEGVTYESGIEEVRGTGDNRKPFVPFTTWKLGPFSKTGLVLVAFRLSLQGESYEKFVAGREYFPVEGPGRLRSNLKHEFIPRCMEGEKEQEDWQDQLKTFSDHISFRRSYDVIILRKPPGSGNCSIDVDLYGSCEIVEAAGDRQPKGKCHPRRYVTMDDRFKLNVSFRELRSYWRKRWQALALVQTHNAEDPRK